MALKEIKSINKRALIDEIARSRMLPEGGTSGQVLIKDTNNNATWTNSSELTSNVNSSISQHIGNASNPHNVTKNQIGLGNVDNTSDMSKPVSTAQQTALNNLKTEVTSTLQTYVDNKLADLPSGGDSNIPTNGKAGQVLTMGEDGELKWADAPSGGSSDSEEIPPVDGVEF